MVDGVYVIQFRVEGLSNKFVNKYQIAFPSEDKILINYKSVMTGDDTFVGVIMGEEEGDRWFPIANHQYEETALLIDLAEAEKPPLSETPVLPIFDWSTDWQWEDVNNVYRVQRKALK